MHGIAITVVIELTYLGIEYNDLSCLSCVVCHVSQQLIGYGDSGAVSKENRSFVEKPKRQKGIITKCLERFHAFNRWRHDGH